MTEFIDWLEKVSKKDSRVRAVLRRSLAFDPGSYPPAFPYVEPFVKDEDNSWRRRMFYLVAGLWASHWREGRTGKPISIARACARHQSSGNSTSTERRFISLLDADSDQLPHRLRQIVTLLKEQPVDFGKVLEGLLYWNSGLKSTQINWAREYYRDLESRTGTEPFANQENSQ
ncbi:MAG: type I-E CRISPR-associated protein Cse2/CasB [Syntrophobacteraceae bacterium]|nr:type I-E CRISPR-associated protein Cse2/CasB [Syntrophobacteraceae bacterium]